jgi:hypothetical protein
MLLESPEDTEEYHATAACHVGEAGPFVEAVLQVAMEQLEAFPDVDAQG